VSGLPVPIGKARIVREGRDLTVITYGKMRKLCEAAAATLAGEGVSIELIDLRTLLPLDTQTILDSVRRTGRVAVVHEAPLTGGLGAELAALVAEKAFGALRGPVVRIAGLDVPMPFAPVLEAAAIPSAATILDGLRKAARG
jgi:pyruvate/2-oxoglutarate/acetoin dehydrogenase E1 component